MGPNAVDASNNQQDEKLRYDGAAALTGLKIPTLQSMVCRRQIPHFRLGRRLVVFSKDDTATQAELKRVKYKGRDQRSTHPHSQLAARYTMIVTSLDAATYPTETVLSLYRQRWQIELAFKRLKSLLHIDRLPAKNKNLARTWLYAHLVLAILIDTMTQQMLDSPPSTEGLE